MRFTTTDLISIELTMEKLHTMAGVFAGKESNDWANVRALLYIAGELRAASKCTDSANPEIRAAGSARLQRLLTKA